jgi:hypothetical protein
MFFDELFGDVPVLAILRGYSPGDAVTLAQRSWSLGCEPWKCRSSVRRTWTRSAPSSTPGRSGECR